MTLKMFARLPVENQKLGIPKYSELIFPDLPFRQSADFTVQAADRDVGRREKTRKESHLPNQLFWFANFHGCIQGH